MEYINVCLAELDSVVEILSIKATYENWGW